MAKYCYILTCKECGFERKVFNYIEHLDHNCPLCGAEVDTEIKEFYIDEDNIIRIKEEVTGDNFPNINNSIKSSNKFIGEPISIEDIKKFNIDLGMVLTFSDLVKKWDTALDK